MLKYCLTDEHNNHVYRDNRCIADSSSFGLTSSREIPQYLPRPDTTTLLANLIVTGFRRLGDCISLRFHLQPVSPDFRLHAMTYSFWVIPKVADEQIAHQYNDRLLYHRHVYRNGYFTECYMIIRRRLYLHYNANIMYL